MLGVVREATQSGVKAPIVMFPYYNPIMARGLDKFCRQIKEAGASGACSVSQLLLYDYAVFVYCCRFMH